MNKDQQRALRILFYHNTPQTKASIPEDVKRDDDWMRLTDDRNPRWWEIRDKLWKLLEPLIGADTSKPVSSARKKKK